MIAELHPVFPVFSPGYSNTALSFSCKLCLTPTLLPGVLCDHLTWALSGQNCPGDTPHVLPFSTRQYFRENKWDGMGIRMMLNLDFYATVLRSWGVSFLVFVSNLSRPDDVFLSIREEPILAGSQHPNILKIDSRHCNPVTFLQHDSIIQRPPTLSRLFEELPPDDGD